MNELPKTYDHLAIEKKWGAEWEAKHVFRAEENASRDEMFVVDTPPPTVSGSLHVGHVFSYTHTDVVARYQRMNGKKVFYPMGWDDNGLATERRVQNKFGIRCNPFLPYDANWKPKAERDEKTPPEEISRNNFIEACAVVTKEDEAAFESLWRRLALSVDWNQQYATIDSHCRLISQLSFLDLVKKGLCYNSESATMWDVDFQTALAQADLEDRTRSGAYHHIKFDIIGGGSFVIATTRPELLVSCIAVVAHPSDARYKPYFGKHAVTPLFRAKVPIVPSDHADPEKGTGIMMICTFGDAADVDWWKRSKLPLKTVIGRNGRLDPVDFTSGPFESLNPEAATKAWSELEGLHVEKARRKIAELLAEPGSAPDGEGIALVKPVEPIEHPVKFYEKGERPIEFITTRQWFIRILDYKKELLGQGDKIHWHPSYMKARYSNWVEGLNQDWCISRQRFFGVPFPVWYPVKNSGEVDYANPIFAKEEQLPVDPLQDAPAGFDPAMRNQPGGFSGDPDVMDTWATSSLTPQLMSKWKLDEGRHKRLFPMDIRPQSHEIIRTWAFYTIAKAWMHDNEIPWRNVIISGWILDPDRKKMSKSKGNTITPAHLLDQYSSDGVRYWAARARLGVDTAFDEKVFKVGQKLVVKLFNASKFVLSQLRTAGSAATGLSVADIKEPLDVSLLARLEKTVNVATQSFESFEYAGALQAAEESFWFFCDNYLELAKARSYDSTLGSAYTSALATLEISLETYLRLFAPFLPYISEEVWSWHFAAIRNQPFIHKAHWPKRNEFKASQDVSSAELLEASADALREIHAEKTRAQRSLGSPLSSLTLIGEESDLRILRDSSGDLERAARLTGSKLNLVSGSRAEGKRFAVELSFSEVPQS